MEDDPDGDVAGLDASVTGFDAFTDLAAPTGFVSFADFDALIGPDHFVIDSDHQRDLKNIVGGLLTLPPSASLGRFLISCLTRQVKP